MGCRGGVRFRKVPDWKQKRDEVRAERENEADLTGIPYKVLATRDRRFRSWKARQKKKGAKVTEAKARKQLEIIEAKVLKEQKTERKDMPQEAFDISWADMLDL